MKKFLAFFVAALTIPAPLRLPLARPSNPNENSDKNLIAANLRMGRGGQKRDTSAMAGFMTGACVQIEMDGIGLWQEELAYYEQSSLG